MKKLVLASLCLVTLSTCGTPDYTVTNQEDFWNQHKPDFISRLQTFIHVQGYEYLIHVHFRGDDFGSLSGKEHATVISNSHNDKPLAAFSISDADSALDIESDFADTHAIASFIYRSVSQVKANNAFKQILGCQNGHFPLEKKILIMGSGGSHGAPALEDFSKQLKIDCGQMIDFAILGDAIEGFGTPMGDFKGLDTGHECIQYYQRSFGQFLQGATLPECVNVFVTNGSHYDTDPVVEYPAELFRHIFRHFEESATNFDLNVDQIRGQYIWFDPTKL